MSSKHIAPADLKLLQNIVSIAFPQSDSFDRFQRFHDLLVRENRKMNLISRNDEARIVTHHFIESVGLASVLNIESGARVLDLGSGAGFPGLPMKLVRPDLNMLLVDSRRKRVGFLQNVIDTLQLTGIQAAASRAEELELSESVDWIVSRAVADCSKLVKWTRRLIRPGGALALLKGPDIDEELRHLDRVPESWRVKKWVATDYNPYPEIPGLRRSKLVIVNKK